MRSPDEGMFLSVHELYNARVEGSACCLDQMVLQVVNKPVFGVDEIRMPQAYVVANDS